MFALSGTSVFKPNFQDVAVLLGIIDQEISCMITIKNDLNHDAHPQLKNRFRGSYRIIVQEGSMTTLDCACCAAEDIAKMLLDLARDGYNISTADGSLEKLNLLSFIN
ncbi:MAG: hypothetical protein ACN6OP_11555 [Pseudomonadales bacterium]